MMSDHRKVFKAIPHAPSGEIAANNEYSNDLLYYDFNNTLMLCRSESMFDHFLIYGFKSIHDKKPSALYHFPTDEATTIQQRYGISIEGLAEFCFPKHVIEDDSDEAYQSILDDRESATRKVMDSTFIFTLGVDMPEDKIPQAFKDISKGAPRLVKYGFCVMTKEPEGMYPSVSQEWRSSRRVGGEELACGRLNLTRRCYCIISANPAFAILYQFMDAFITRERLTIKRSAGLVQTATSPRDATLQMLEKFYAVQVPKPNQSKCFRLKHDLREEIFSFSKTTKDGLIAEWCFPPTFKIVNTNSLLRVLAFLMMEASLIVSTLSSGIASAVIFTFLMLMRPLSWTGSIMTVVPASSGNEIYVSFMNYICYTHRDIDELIGKTRSDVVMFGLDSTPLRCRIPKQSWGFKFEIPYTKKLKATLADMQRAIKEHMYMKEVNIVMKAFQKFQCKLLYKILRNISPLQLDIFKETPKDLATLWYKSNPKRTNNDLKKAFVTRFVSTVSFGAFIEEFGDTVLRVIYHSNLREVKKFEDCFKSMRKKLFLKL